MTNSPALLAAFGFGGTELIVIFLIILVLFGGAKLPGLAKGLGQSIREFKKAAKDEDEETPPKAVEPKIEAKKPDPANTHGSN
jgi:sec-independent protein translocase protein TatA